jgi:hypothetical protein
LSIIHTNQYERKKIKIASILTTAQKTVFLEVGRSADLEYEKIKNKK